jgi:hypothetical protein
MAACRLAIAIAGLVQNVMPAQAGIQGHRYKSMRFWIPAFAGMTAAVSSNGMTPN